MSEWFQAKVKFLRQMSNGLIKQITEQYLVDSMSFTECEARVLKEQGEGVREVTCQSIARSPIKEVVFYGDTDLWHKVKVTYSTMDEVTEKEKKVTTHFLVNAADVKEAYARTEEHLKEMLVPFSIPKVEESPICEVFQYEKAAPKGMVKVEKANTTYQGEEIESEEECAMEGDSVEVVGNGMGMIHNVPKLPFARLSSDGTTIEYSNPTTEYVTNTKAKAIDPTDGKAIGFEVDPLWDFLASIGFNALPSDLEEIRHMHQDVQLMDFEGWLLQEYLIEGDNARKVSEFLRRENEAKTQIAD